MPVGNITSSVSPALVGRAAVPRAVRVGGVASRHGLREARYRGHGIHTCCRVRVYGVAHALPQLLV